MIYKEKYYLDKMPVEKYHDISKSTDKICYVLDLSNEKELFEIIKFQIFKGSTTLTPDYFDLNTGKKANYYSKNASRTTYQDDKLFKIFLDKSYFDKNAVKYITIYPCLIFSKNISKNIFLKNLSNGEYISIEDDEVIYKNKKYKIEYTISIDKIKKLNYLTYDQIVDNTYGAFYTSEKNYPKGDMELMLMHFNILNKLHALFHPSPYALPLLKKDRK